MENLSVTKCVATNIRRERQRLGWGLAELSEHVTAAGHPLSLKTLSKIETGLRGIDVEDLQALASTLSVSVDELLTDPALREIEPLHQLLAAYRSAADEWLKAARLQRQTAVEMDFTVSRLRDFVRDHPTIKPALDEALEQWLGKRTHVEHGWRRRQLEARIFNETITDGEKQ
jgi:transcriptional regulator with XRE-family HTH domain